MTFGNTEMNHQADQHIYIHHLHSWFSSDKNCGAKMNLPIALTYRILDCKLEQILSVWAVFLIDETKLRDVFLEQSVF